MRHVLGALVMVSLATAPARAQPGTNSALAEQLFNQARDLAKANQWAAACPKFEASLRYDPVLGTRLNLATCYEKIGRLASAWGLYREAVELATRAGDRKRAEYAQRQATALEPRLPKLAIAAPASPPPGLVVKRDDVPVAPAELGVALYVDPGAHVITASAPGFETVSLTATSVEGKTETLALPTLVATPVAPVAQTAPVEAPVEAPDDSPPPSRTRAYVGLGVGAAGLAAVGVGLVFGAKARSASSDAKALCGDDLRCAPETFARGSQLTDDAASHAKISTALVIAGGAAVAAGVVLYLTAPRGRERETAARLVPTPQLGGAGVALIGGF